MLCYFHPRVCRKLTIRWLQIFSFHILLEAFLFLITLPTHLLSHFVLCGSTCSSSKFSFINAIQFLCHPSQSKKECRWEQGVNLRSHLFLPSGNHQKYLVGTNNPSRIWPIHRMIRYKIKQKSLLNSELWSGPLCCQNNNISLGEQSQSRWERSSCQGSTAKEQEAFQQQLEPAWVNYLFLWDSLRRCFFLGGE